MFAAGIQLLTKWYFCRSLPERRQGYDWDCTSLLTSRVFFWLCFKDLMLCKPFRPPAVIYHHSHRSHHFNKKGTHTHTNAHSLASQLILDSLIRAKANGISEIQTCRCKSYFKTMAVHKCQISDDCERNVCSSRFSFLAENAVCADWG